MDPASSVFLLCTVLLILANALFVATEFAIVRVRLTRLEQLAAQGHSRAATAIHVVKNLDKYVSASQLGITLASLGVGWLGEPAFAAVLLKWLTPLGVAEGTTHAVSLAVAFFIITLLHVIIGEQAPKLVAIRNSLPLTLWMATPLRWFYILMYPATSLISILGKGVARLFGAKNADAAETQHTADELRLILSRSPGMLDPHIRQMMVRMLDYRRRKARHVMTPASDTTTLRSNQSVDEATRAALESRYTRYPILDTVNTRVLGFVHMQDLFSVYTGQRKANRLVELMREPLYALDDTPIDKLRVEMQSRQLHLAIINNADGVFVGIVTLEDLLEEIVGEIRDESDEEVAPIARRSDDVLEVSGRVLLEDLERETSVTLLPPVPDAETVQAYLQKRLGSILKVGDRCECDGYLIIVTEAQPRRVGRVRIIRRPTQVQASNISA